MTLSNTEIIDHSDSIPFDEYNAKPIEAESIEEVKPKNIKPLTKRDKALIKVGNDIQKANPKKASQLVYMHSIMCQIGLPRSAVEGKVFERVCGNAGMYITAGALYNGTTFIPKPIPFGSYPRLVLAHLNTMALYQKSPVINIKTSMAQFLKLIGKRASGGPKGTNTIFQEHISALAACNISLGLTTEYSAITYDGKPISRLEAFLPTDKSKSGNPQTITLSNEYYESLKSHAIPLDMRALNALAPNSLAIDIYMMLADRLHRINGKHLILHWKNLKDQFGQEYTGKNAPRDFKKSFKAALRDALKVYPWAKVKEVKGGILMIPSNPPVPFKPTKEDFSSDLPDNTGDQ